MPRRRYRSRRRRNGRPGQDHAREVRLDSLLWITGPAAFTSMIFDACHDRRRERARWTMEGTPPGAAPPGRGPSRGDLMGLVIVLIVLAVIFGGVGLFVAAAKWALIIALILLIAGAVMGFLNRRRS